MGIIGRTGIANKVQSVDYVVVSGGIRGSET